MVKLVDLNWVKDDSLERHNLGIWGKDNAGSEVFRVRLTEDLPGTTRQPAVDTWNAATLSSPNLSFLSSRTGEALGELSYSGGVVGVHTYSDEDDEYGPYFEGLLTASVDLSSPESVKLTFNSFYKGNFSGSDTFEYTIPFFVAGDMVTTTFEGRVPSASTVPNAKARIRGNLYGPDFEGIGGALQDFDADIAIAVFGGTREGVE